MDWKDKMKKAMKAIKEACEENTTWIGEKREDCCQCPFFICCNTIELAGLSIPDEWGPNVDEF